MDPEDLKPDVTPDLLSQDASAVNANPFVSGSSSPKTAEIAIPKRVYHPSPLEVRPSAIYPKENGLFTTHALNEGDLITPPLLTIVSHPPKTRLFSIS